MTIRADSKPNRDKKTPTSVIQPQLLGHLNEVAVLRAIQRNGELSRSELSKIAGVTFPTAAKAVASLVERGLLEEIDRESVGRGRPAKCVRISTDRSTVLGITLSRSNCEIVAAGFDGTFRQESLLAFPPPSSYEELLKNLTDYKNSLEDRPESPYLRAAVSIPGMIDYRESRVYECASFPWLNGQAVTADFSKALGVECIMVHDVHALCLAEYLYDNASDYGTYCVLDGSTGLGIGIMSNGNLFFGGRGYTGEIGHGTKVGGDRLCKCGRKGCLETVASEWGMLNTATEAIGRTLAFEEFVELAGQGDKAVLASVEQLTDHLAMALSQVYSLFNPECLYLQGRMFHQVPGLLEQLLEKTLHQTLPAIFESASIELASKTVLQGAVASAIASITATPVDSLRASLHGVSTISAFARTRTE